MTRFVEEQPASCIVDEWETAKRMDAAAVESIGRGDEGGPHRCGRAVGRRNALWRERPGRMPDEIDHGRSAIGVACRAREQPLRERSISVRAEVSQ